MSEATTSKKDMILAAVTELGADSSAAEVQAYLAENYDGAEVSVNYISMVRNEGNSKKGKFSVSDAVAELVKLRTLVEELGGIETVREAVETAGKFTEVVGTGNEIEALEQLEQLG